MASTAVASRGDSRDSFELQSRRLVLENVEAPEDAQSALPPVSKAQQFTVLMCAFLDVIITIGLNQAYGVFLNQYLADKAGEDHFLLPGEANKKALLAFVGTLAGGLTWGGSIVINPIMARTKDPRIITVCGAVCIGLGYILASFSTRVSEPSPTQSRAKR